MLDRNTLEALYKSNQVEERYGKRLDVFSGDFLNAFSALNQEAMAHGGNRPSIDKVMEELLIKYDTGKKPKH